MALTSKQKKEVNLSIMGYFKSSGFDEVAEVFAEENPEAVIAEKDEKKYLTNLERKWRSIIRLNQKIASLKEENEALQEELDTFKSGTKVNTDETEPKKVNKVMEVHKSQVTGICFYPKADKKLLASCSEDGLIIIWDFAEGRLKKILNSKNTEPIECVAFSPDGKVLISGGEDCKIRFWNMEDYSLIGKPLSAHEHTVSGLVWTKNSSQFFSCSRDKTIKRWNYENRKQLKVYNDDESVHTDWIKNVILSPDEKHMATAGLDQVIATWDLSTGETQFEFRDHENAIESIAYSNALSDKFVIENCLDDHPKDAKLATLKKAELKEGEDVGGMFLVSTSRDKTIMIWFLVQGVCVKTIKGHDNWVKEALWHPSGRFLVTCSDDKSILVWDIKKNFRLHLKFADAHESFIHSIKWHKSIPVMVSAGQNGEIKSWICK